MKIENEYEMWRDMMGINGDPPVATEREALDFCATRGLSIMHLPAQGDSQVTGGYG